MHPPFLPVQSHLATNNMTFIICIHYDVLTYNFSFISNLELLYCSYKNAYKCFFVLGPNHVFLQ